MQPSSSAFARAAFWSSLSARQRADDVVHPLLPAQVDRSPIGPVVYVSGEFGGPVYGFEQSNPSAKPFIQLEDVVSPWGLYVDSAHNLWVADTGRKALAVYRKGDRRAYRMLNDPGGPTDVTICPNGTVYSADGNVVAYDHNAQQPTRVLTDPDIIFLFVTCDAANNVVADGLHSGASLIDVFVGGVQAGLQRLPIAPQVAGGLQALPSGTFLVAEPFGTLENSNPIVAEYTETGKPGRVIQTGTNYLMGIGMSRDQKHLFGAYWQGSSIVEYAWPSGTLVKTIPVPGGSSIQTWGLAVDPPQIPGTF